jgi:ribosomal protein L18E
MYFKTFKLVKVMGRSVARKMTNDRRKSVSVSIFCRNTHTKTHGQFGNDIKVIVGKVKEMLK